MTEKKKPDFNLVAKILLGLSIVSFAVEAVSNFINYYTYSSIMAGGNLSQFLTTAIIDVLLIVSAVLIFCKKRYGLLAFVLLAIVKMIMISQNQSGTSVSNAYLLGQRTVVFMRDFGLFAIAMCFKKNGVSGWKSMLASEDYSRTHTMVNDSDSEEPSLSEEIPVPEAIEQVTEQIPEKIVDNIQPVYLEQSVEAISDPICDKDHIEKENDMSIDDTHTFKEALAKKSKAPTRKRINWKKVLPIAIPSLCGAGILTLLILVLSADYPDNFNRFGDKFKYYFNIPNNRLAKEYLVKYRSATQTGLDEMSKEFAETARLASPTNPDLVDSLAAIYFELGLANNSETEYYKKTIEISESGLKKNPNDQYLMDRYIRALYNLGNMPSSASLNPTVYKEKAYTMAEKLLLLEPLAPVGIDVMCRKSIENDDWNNLMRWSEKGLVLKESSFYPEFLYFNAKALFEKGECTKAQEMYFAAEELDGESYYHAKFARIGGIPCKVISVEIENCTGEGKVVTKAGNTLYDDNTRYLAPILKIEPYRSGRFNFQVKLFHNGTLSTSDSSPTGYTFAASALLAESGLQTIRLKGWGSDTPGNWGHGGYRVEIWWEGEKLYTYSFNIYSGFWHNLGYSNRFD